MVVAISWSGYFNNLLVHIFDIHLPGWLLIDPDTATNAYRESVAALTNAAGITDVDKLASYRYAVDAYEQAPTWLGYKIFFNFPALCIVLLVTWLSYIGIKESKQSANAMVLFKIGVIIFVIIAGAFFVDTNNWQPFLPNGFEGVLKGVSAVFYAYIGFDAISTTAEECKDPKRDMPRGMIYSLLICTVLYILITLVLTGMERYDRFEGVNDPLAFVFEKRAPWIEKIVSVSAIIATTSVLLVFQIGQSRIWMSMSRDGLLPKKFQQVHPRYQTPGFATIVTGFFIGIGAMLIRSGLVTDLTSIGTLFAFVLVSAGVLFLPKIKPEPGKFLLPYINGKWIVPLLYAGLIYLFQDRVGESLNQLISGQWDALSLVQYLFLICLGIGLYLSVQTFLRNYSLIPILGVLSCMYLMIEIPAISWVWFLGWMAGGLGIYFLYGYRHSRLAE